VKTSIAVLVASALLSTSTGCAALKDDPRTITVMLPDSAGLFVGNDVGVLGVRIGEVTALKTQGSVVEVTLTLSDEDVKIPANAGAAVVARSVAADRYVELTPVYDGGPTLTDGATIPATRTVTPVDFDEVLSSMKRLGDDLTNSPGVTNNLRDLVDVSASTLKGQGPHLNEATHSIADAVAEVAGQRHTLVGSLRSMSELTTTLSTNEATVRAFIHNIADAAHLLSSERLNIGGALRSLSASIDDVSRLAATHRVAIGEDLRKLTRVLRRTVRSRADLEAALDTLPLAGQNLDRATSNGRMRVQLDPAALTPLGPQLEQLCSWLGSLCNAVSIPPSLDAILDALGVGRPR